MELPRLRAVLEEYGQAVAQQYKDNLVRDGRPASGDLIRSITTFVEVNGQGYEVKMSLNDYWKYIEYGTKGWLTGNTSRRFPPPAAIEHWIQVKPGLPKPATIQERKSLAYLIGRKIRCWRGGGLFHLFGFGNHGGCRRLKNLLGRRWLSNRLWRYRLLHHRVFRLFRL